MKIIIWRHGSISMEAASKKSESKMANKENESVAREKRITSSKHGGEKRQQSSIISEKRQRSMAQHHQHANVAQHGESIVAK